MPGQFLTDDLDGFLQTDDFASAATFDGSTINVILDREFLAQTVNGEVGIESTRPIVHCKASDVESATHGDRIKIGTQRYRIDGIEPDNTGFTVMVLSVTDADKNYGSVTSVATVTIDYGSVADVAVSTLDYGSVAE